MSLFQERDYELIAEAKKAIRLNYDQKHYNHTVGAAIRCKNGKVYAGVFILCMGPVRSKWQ